MTEKGTAPMRTYRSLQTRHRFNWPAMLASCLSLLVLLSAATLCFAQEESTPNAEPAQSTAKIEQYVIEPDDVLQVTVFAGGEAQKELELLVNSDGYVTFPYIGQVKAAGRTIKELAQATTKKLAGDYFIAPQVLIKFKEISKIFVLGYVVKPGAFPYQEGMTALEASTLAGGFAKYAAPNRTIITRSKPDGSREKIEVDLEAAREGNAEDLNLRPGDRIFVPRSWF
jgi:protein involved in polysaccharide export with SLBB domain